MKKMLAIGIPLFFVSLIVIWIFLMWAPKTVEFYVGDQLYMTTKSKFGGKVEKVIEPTKKSDNYYDYVFTGWTPDIYETKINRRQRVTALFKSVPIDYQISYDLDGGRFISDYPTKYNCNSLSSLAAKPVKEGFVFAYFEYPNGDMFRGFHVDGARYGDLFLKAVYVVDIGGFSDGLQFKTNSDGNIAVSYDYVSNYKNINIPETFNGENVYEIDRFGFFGSGVETVIINSELLNIPKTAFYGCPNTKIFLNYRPSIPTWIDFWTSIGIKAYGIDDWEYIEGVPTPK